MRHTPATGLALLLAGLTACSGSPDTAAAEDDLAAVDGVVDVDAEWVEGSFKVASSAAVSVAVGEDLDAESAAALAPALLDALADLDWESTPALAVELDDEADATPFLPRRPDDDPAPRPTDVSTYTADAGDLDGRDLAADLALLVDAREVLDAPTQLEATGEGVLTLQAGLGVDAAASAGLVREASTDRALTAEGIRWRLTGPDLTLELESGLTPADANLWALLVGDSDGLGGLRRDRVVLSVDAEQPLRLAQLELAADTPAEPATGRVTAPAEQLYERLAAAGVDELRVVVTGSDTQMSRSFSATGANARWAEGG